jgi:hypothetical protein
MYPTQVKLEVKKIFYAGKTMRIGIILSGSKLESQSVFHRFSVLNDLFSCFFSSELCHYKARRGGKLKHIKIDNFYSIREIKNVLYSVSGN